MWGFKVIPVDHDFEESKDYWLNQPHPKSLSVNGEGLETRLDSPSPFTERGLGGEVNTLYSHQIVIY